MIGEAISSSNDRSGSNQTEIAKFIKDKYNITLPPNFKKVLSVQLKRLVKSEKLVKTKNSYKVSASDKVKSAAVKTVKESQKKTDFEKVISVGDVERVNPKGNAPKKGEKMKRLSQVKTPEALKKNITAKKVVKSSTATLKKART